MLLSVSKNVNRYRPLAFPARLRYPDPQPWRRFSTLEYPRQTTVSAIIREIGQRFPASNAAARASHDDVCDP